MGFFRRFDLDETVRVWEGSDARSTPLWQMLLARMPSSTLKFDALITSRFMQHHNLTSFTHYNATRYVIAQQEIPISTDCAKIPKEE